MASIKLQFYKTDTDQRTCDILFHVRRPDRKKIDQWSVSQKIMAKAFINDMEATFNRYKREIEEAINL